MRLIPAIALLVLIILVSGCIEKQEYFNKESSNPNAETNKDPSSKLNTQTQNSYDENQVLVKLPEEDKKTVQSQPEEQGKAIPAVVPKQIVNTLTEWTKEEGLRIGGVSSCTLFKNNEYWMYYTGQGIELAKSSDGLNFIYVEKLIDSKDVEGVDMVTNPAVFEMKDGNYRMLFEGSKMFDNKNDRKLYSAISSDGLTWKIEEGIRFQDVGDGKPGEMFTSVPDIIRLNDGSLRMYYTRGLTSATAVSNDDGLTWAKETNLELRKISLDPEIVLLEDGNYKLFFTTFENEFGVGEQWIMSASSSNGINFVLDEGKLIGPSTSGGLVTDPDVVKIDKGYRMYYSEFKKNENGAYGQESYILSAFSSNLLEGQ
ncbi:MAG: hypothetical protein COT15_01755 [Candidatus Diapherotrites archaeon CG08_land_8_20_14_0_20_34_12]|nr:MAG: hypothetical protein COT15_01755 [Candidatus Diapherotrites archaeon CG08_land_8_20_14_0_20_34_12]